MQFKSFQPITLSLLILAAAGWTGCDTLNQSPDTVTPVSVKMHIGEAGTSPMAKVAGSNTTASGHITLSEVKMLVEELELESALDDSMDIEIENRVVNIPLDSTVVDLASAEIPNGLYEEFELEIDKADDDEDEGEQRVDDPDFSDGENRYSLVVKGQYNGQDFTFRSDREYEVDFEFEPPLEIDGQSDAASIDITLDLASWFVDPESGNDLDPTDSGNADQIEQNIARSFDADTEVEEDQDENKEDPDTQEQNDEEDVNQHDDD